MNEKLKRLATHFTNYWIKQGEANRQPALISIVPTREAAEAPAPAPVPKVEETKEKPKVEVPKAKEPAKPKESDIVETMESLDDVVDKVLTQKVNVTIKRVVEDEVRNQLGKQFTNLEKGIRPDVKEEVQDAAVKVEKEIKEVIPAIQNVEKQVEEKVAPKEPVKEVPKAAAASLSTESIKEDDNMALDIKYHEGNTFEDSYFVATEGDETKVVNASRVIPAEVQERIAAAEEKNEEANDILSPEEAIEEIKKLSNNTMEGFKAWAATLPKVLVKAASLEKKGEWAINEAEIPKQPKVSQEDGPEKAVSVEEADKGLKDSPLPTGKGSKVKQYYGRLPGQAVGTPDNSLNLHSDIATKYKLTVTALEEEKAKNEMLVKKLDDVSKEKGKIENDFGKMKDDKDVAKKKTAIDEIVKALKLDEEAKKDAVDMLSKVDVKALEVFEEVAELCDGAKKAAPAIPPVPKAGPIPPMKAASANLFEGVNLPQIGVDASAPLSLIDSVSKMLDHN